MTTKARTSTSRWSARRPWTASELATVRAWTGTTKELAEHLNRTDKAIYQCRFKLGMCECKANLAYPAGAEIAIAKLHAKGFDDADIAERLAKLRRFKKRPIGRRGVGTIRARLGLPPNFRTDSAPVRKKKLLRVALQMKAMGLDRPNDLRRVAWAKFAVDRGWPAHLSPREVQIVTALYQRGPQTRKGIATLIGLPWLGSRKSMRSRGPGGCYLGNLQQYGLVVRLPRRVSVNGCGKGGSVYLYAVATNVKRGPIAEHLLSGSCGKYSNRGQRAIEKA